MPATAHQFREGDRAQSAFYGRLTTDNGQRTTIVTTFDRYLIRRFLHVFAILFVTTFGLYVVIDGFTNVDEFQQADDSALGVLSTMAVYYAFQSSLFLKLAGLIIAEISIMVVFALLLKNSELQPVLAAGVPTYRLVVPLIGGMLVVNGLLIANQELVIPRIAHRLTAPRDAQKKDTHRVEPIYDYNRIHLDGETMYPAERRIERAQFTLPVPEIAHNLTTLKAREAVYREETGDRPSGWLLRDVAPRGNRLDLTSRGEKIVRVQNEPAHVFVVTDVGFDQLYNRNQGYRYLSTPELIRRVQSPSYGLVSSRSQILHLHKRLTQPLMAVAVMLVAVPFVVRKESPGLITNMALCTVIMGLVYGVSQLFLYLGRANLFSADVAVWVPLILTGALAAGLSESVQT